MKPEKEPFFRSESGGPFWDDLPLALFVILMSILLGGALKSVKPNTTDHTTQCPHHIERAK